MRGRIGGAFLGICCACGGVEAGEHKALAERVEHLQQRLDALERRNLEASKAPAEVPVQVVAEPAVARKEALTIRISAGGVAIGGRTIPDDQLDDELRRRADSKSVSHVVVEADSSVEYSLVVALMDRVRSAGFERLAIAARRDTGTGMGTGTEEAGF